MCICVVVLSGECLQVKADMELFASNMCDPYLSALEALAKTRYTNRCYVVTFTFTLYDN